MNKEFIEQNDIAHKYLTGQLSDTELEEFEVYLMDNPSVIDDLNVEEVMSAGMSAIKEPEGVARPSQPAIALPFWQKSSIATALGSFVLGVLTMMVFNIDHGPINSPQIQYLVTESSVRGGSDDTPPVEFEFDESSFARGSRDQFTLVADTTDYGGTRHEVVINLESPDKKKTQVMKLEHVVPNAEGQIVLTLNISDFSPGKYEMAISAGEIDGIHESRSRFKLIAKTEK